MIPAGISSVTARIAELQQRFAVPPAFTADIPALAQAGQQDSPVAAAAPASTGLIDFTPRNSAASATAAPASAVAGAAGRVSIGGAGATAAAGAPGPWAARLPAAGARWAPAIQSAAEKAGLDPTLLAALVQHESGFRADARSHAGAIGLGQLMPGTARELGVDPTDPQQNLNGAARYLKTQLDRFGRIDLALAAYNAGPGRVAQAGGVPRITETQNYVRRVSATHHLLRSA